MPLPLVVWIVGAVVLGVGGVIAIGLLDDGDKVAVGRALAAHGHETLHQLWVIFTRVAGDLCRKLGIKATPTSNVVETSSRTVSENDASIPDHVREKLKSSACVHVDVTNEYLEMTR
jgi:hypothetical protein